MVGRILIIAEAANPEWVSVPLVGWSLYRALSSIADVHLVTHVRNSEALVKAGLVEGRDFTPINNEWMAAPLYKLSDLLRGGKGKGWTTLTAFSAFSYYFFEMELWRQFSDRIKAGEFSVVHRITPLSPTTPSLIAKKLYGLGVPFIIGPLNGGVPWPAGFHDRQIKENEWLSSLRWVYKLMPAYSSTRTHAAAIIVGSNFTFSDMPRGVQEKCILIPENGVSAETLNYAKVREKRKLPLKAAFVGRLVPYKGADILLKASVEFLQAGELEVEIIGDGPQRVYLEKLVRDMNVVKGVNFRGWLPHSDVKAILGDCDFLGFPSIREFGGGVVLEAMALGVVPVVADYAGPSELFGEQEGFRVPFSNEETLIEGFRQAIGHLISNPSCINELGSAGQRKVRLQYTWEEKARQIISVYDTVSS